MKRTFSLLLFILLVSNTFAHVKFEGVELTGSKQTFVEKLQHKGYTFVCDNGNKSILEGKYNGMACSVIVYAYSQSIDIVYRVEVLTKTYVKWENLKAEFDRIEQKLVAMYGTPTNETKLIYPPFSEENNEMLGISLNSFRYQSTWEELDDATIRLSLNSDACVEIRLVDRSSESMGKKMQQVSVQKAVEGTKEVIGNFFNSLRTGN